MGSLKIKSDKGCKHTWQCELIISVEGWTGGDIALELGSGSRRLSL